MDVVKSEGEIDDERGRGWGCETDDVIMRQRGRQVEKG
jgi:hypothetical protein